MKINTIVLLRFSAYSFTSTAAAANIVHVQGWVPFMWLLVNFLFQSQSQSSPVPVPDSLFHLRLMYKPTGISCTWSTSSTWYLLQLRGTVSHDQYVLVSLWHERLPYSTLATKWYLYCYVSLDCSEYGVYVVLYFSMQQTAVEHDQNKNRAQAQNSKYSCFFYDIFPHRKNSITSTLESLPFSKTAPPLCQGVCVSHCHWKQISVRPATKGARNKEPHR